MPHHYIHLILLLPATLRLVTAYVALPHQPDKKHFKAVPEARRFETPYRSLQGWLWELDEPLWHLAKRLPDYTPRKKRRNKPMPLQLPLLEDPPVAQE
jgi:hypothetical protein